MSDLALSLFYVMEFFSDSFEEKMAKKQIQSPFRRRGIIISHPLYADDVLLFAVPNKEVAE